MIMSLAITSQALIACVCIATREYALGACFCGLGIYLCYLRYHEEEAE